MTRKSCSIATTLAMLTVLISALFVTAPTASAWTGRLPTCPNFSTTWIQTIKANQYYGPNTSWIAYRSNAYSPMKDMVVVYYDTYAPAGQRPHIGFRSDSAGDSPNTFEYDANSVPYWVNVPGEASGYIQSRQTWDNLHYGTILSNIDCIADVHNVYYDGWGDQPRYKDSLAEWAVTHPQSAKYVAMGDSYSAGEGVPAFEVGTDVAASEGTENKCHRSRQAYSQILASNPALNLNRLNFVACSGATISDVLYSGQWNEPPQIEALSADTAVVTLTIGGNDVGFGDYLLGCLPGCGKGSLIYDAFMNNIHADAFKNNLVTTYQKILAKAPNAKLYVLGYPYLTSPTAKNCNLLDVSAARSVQVELNSVISKAVTAARNTSRANKNRIVYVNPNASGSPFANRYVCSKTSFFNGLDLLHKEYSFHPNAAGQASYAKVIAAAMKK